jgi:hypothetical protein
MKLCPIHRALLLDEWDGDKSQPPPVGLLFLSSKPDPAISSHKKRKEPPGNRAALSSGRIVPTEAKPSELSGCIVGAGKGSVKEKSEAK